MWNTMYIIDLAPAPHIVPLLQGVPAAGAEAAAGVVRRGGAEHRHARALRGLQRQAAAAAQPRPRGEEGRRERGRNLVTASLRPKGPWMCGSSKNISMWTSSNIISTPMYMYI